MKGVCCAKVSEVEAMLKGGVVDLHLSNEIVSPSKLNRLCSLIKETPQAQVSICVDSELGVERLAQAVSTYEMKMNVVIEVNVGQNRCGVTTAEQVLTLAKLVHTKPGLTYIGLQGYHGGVQHVREHKQRQEMIDKVVDIIKPIIKLLKEQGFVTQVVTGAGTGSYLLEAASGVYTELQPGSYLFNDVGMCLCVCVFFSVLSSGTPLALLLCPSA